VFKYVYITSSSVCSQSKHVHEPGDFASLKTLGLHACLVIVSV